MSSHNSRYSCCCCSIRIFAPPQVSIITNNSYTPISLSASSVTSVSSSVVSIDKADLMFFLDTTGSMAEYINSVTDNLSAFAHYLVDHGIDMRFAVIEFKDVIDDGYNSTKINTFMDGSVWTSDIAEVESVLASISVSGGGDTPETPMQAITLFLSEDITVLERTAEVRGDTMKFAFVLTDAQPKDITGSHQYVPNTETLISYLRRLEVSTTVVSEASYEYDYHDLYTQTGGKFIDINSSNYYELMIDIAEWIVENTDTDGDGLPDIWETEGIDVDGVHVDLPAMGADPNSPDIFVYYDWMHKDADVVILGIRFGEKDLKPDAEVFELIARQFWNHGIRFHAIDGKSIPYEDIFDCTDYSHWNSTAIRYFPRQYWNIARYCIFLNRFRDSDGQTGYTGLTEALPGQFFIVSQGLLDNVIQTAGTFMHELGHALGLRHGGNDHVQYKPNYLSVMNYLYQLSGLIINTGETWKMVNYSDYELQHLDEQNIDETKGLDPSGDVNSEVGAKWKLTLSSGKTKTVSFKPFLPSGIPMPSRAGNVGIAHQSIDFNDNGTIEANTTADFYINGGNASYDNREIIPQSQNDWANLKFRGGAVGYFGVSMSGDISLLVSRDMSQPMIEEFTLEEARSLDLIGNPDDCTITAIMPDILFSYVSSQSVRITVENLFSSETTAAIEVKSELLNETFRTSLDIEPRGNNDVFIPVKPSISAGDYLLECVLTRANSMSSDVQQTIHVLDIRPFTVEEGGNLTIDAAMFGGCTPEIDDTSIATLNGTVIHGVKAGQTFIILRDNGRMVCTFHVNVTSKPKQESTDIPPELSPQQESQDVQPELSPQQESPDVQPDLPTQQESPDIPQQPERTLANGGSGGCNDGYSAVIVIFCALVMLRRR